MLAELQNISVHMLEEAWPYQDLIQVSFITLRGYCGSYLVKDEEDGRWRTIIINIALFFLVLFFLLPGMMIFSMLMRDHVDSHTPSEREPVRNTR